VIIARDVLTERDEPCVLLDIRASSDPTLQGLGLDPQVFGTTAYIRVFFSLIFLHLIASEKDTHCSHWTHDNQQRDTERRRVWGSVTKA
jgi:hypothetical protein